MEGGVAFRQAVRENGRWVLRGVTAEDRAQTPGRDTVSDASGRDSMTLKEASMGNTPWDGDRSQD